MTGILWFLCLCLWYEASCTHWPDVLWSIHSDHWVCELLQYLLDLISSGFGILFKVLTNTNTQARTNKFKEAILYAFPDPYFLSFTSMEQLCPFYYAENSVDIQSRAYYNIVLCCMLAALQHSTMFKASFQPWKHLVSASSSYLSPFVYTLSHPFFCTTQSS